MLLGAIPNQINRLIELNPLFQSKVKSFASAVFLEGLGCHIHDIDDFLILVQQFLICPRAITVTHLTLFLHKDSSLLLLIIKVLTIRLHD